jgi:heat shock protein HtpX
MTTVMFLLGAAFVAIVVALMFALPSSYAPFIAVIAIGFAFYQWWSSDKVAMRAMRAREVTPEEAPELHGMIDRLCAMADMPKPRVGVADLDIPNAFATGRSPERSVVCVTTGILGMLTAEELEGVLAHELSHVAHRDVAVMTIASFLGILAGLVVRYSFYAGAFGGGGGWGRSNDNRDNSGMVILLVVLASAVVYALSFLLTRALSRYRELSADRSGAILIGRPSTLASALVKVSGEMGRIPTRDLRAAEPLNAFFFAPALAPGFSFSSLFATHPPLERRLDQLARLEAQLGRQA